MGHLNYTSAIRPARARNRTPPDDPDQWIPVDTGGHQRTRNGRAAVTKITSVRLTSFLGHGVFRRVGSCELPGDVEHGPVIIGHLELRVMPDPGWVRVLEIPRIPSIPLGLRCGATARASTGLRSGVMKSCHDPRSRRAS